MAPHIQIAFFSIALFALLSNSSSSPTKTSGNTINKWCNTTPHPKVCIFFMSPLKSPPQNRLEFRKMAIKTTLEGAAKAQNYVSRFGPTCKTTRQRAAWTDCFNLYNDTVFQLNRTIQCLDGGNRLRHCTDFDAQTWLSSALTNIDMCSSGAADLNVTDFITPIKCQNVSKMISNCLAINGRFLQEETKSRTMGTEEYQNGFPTWVSSGDRKLLQSARVRAHLVVAKDGSGKFRTVQAAINAAARRRGRSRFVIYIKRGVYKENIEVGNDNANIMLVGDGIRFTVITSGRSVAAGFTTFNSATAGIQGPGFMARGIRFVNTAGPRMGQAVALRSSSDLSVFHRCSFEGYQDTLMVLSQRQFYKQCYVYGTIDFIFGNAAVVLQNCLIYVRRPLKGQVNVITAQGREDPFQNSGISIHNSQIRAAADLQPMIGSVKTYLGRPWKKYSRTVIMRSYIDSLVSPMGWLAWQGTRFAQDTLYYGEYRNFGPRASTRLRVRWPGFHAITTRNVASKFTVRRLIAGHTWLPATGVPFKLDL
ncbi:putative pectinesterase/pectinesterase inhibitor 33, partial [Cucurbita argyrosperma subsp. argyrosperma]